ncbi:hypothetical protein CHH91_04445 [Virgibacillus sp. 7505]|uniref:hypothetical protein n=1 Tax=Virgibacillus sp. 7505 TaxID=2022548 RepID=UPI000BA70D05|nr:hypothetical protein [Virgibacillus sp. 7505]PAE17262.1 hypothetical protein CHH91_04445 [Virgibacillus sp. 7505]
MANLVQQFEQSQQPSVLGQASSSREMEEVKGQIFMARQFPRNIYQAEQRILDNCKRASLAEVAVYSYPRGGTKVEGPSIRLAEVLAQNWGNLSFGVKELEQREGESVALAYAWDLETNVRQEKVFTVKHSRKAGGKLKKLDDPRDIYELVANNGSRRVRACILGIIPGDIVEKAVQECNKTLEGGNGRPLKDRIAKTLELFKEEYGVTQQQLEEYVGYNISAFTDRDLAGLGKIYTSLKDGMSKPVDWFGKKAAADKPKDDKPSSKLAADMQNEQDKPKEVKDDVSVNDLDPSKLPLD